MVLSEDEKSDNEDKEETELGVMEDQRSIILHLISQLKLGMDLTKVGWHVPLDLWFIVGVLSLSSSLLYAHPFRCGEIGEVEWGKRPALLSSMDIPGIV